MESSDVSKVAVNFEAVKTSMSQSKQGTILRLALHPNEVPPSLHTDWVGSRYMVAMVKLGDDEQPVMSDQQREVEKMVASAGMLCRNDEFAEFLHQRGYMADNDYIDSSFGEREQVVTKTLRSVLGVSSRSELKNNSEAREIFKGLTEEFTRWKQGYEK
ncbi:MAG: hypothetical protein CL857_02415 [Cryomorphaceae bacterium]|nr:hypothetical protein [Cryomorphaceae bacterium]|tara:strand:- start:4931 stop:5407 length:477 start_codon:yes stop_codon:yes gene_type:complete